MVDSEILKLKEDINFLKMLRDDNRNLKFINSNNIKIAKNDFFHLFENFSDEVKEYGWDIKIKILIRDGSSSYEPFVLQLEPFNHNKDFLLIGYFEDKQEKMQLQYSFNPSMKENIEEPNKIIMPAFDFVYLQVLEEKDEILEKFKKQLKEDVEKHLEFDSYLNKLYKKYE